MSPWETKENRRQERNSFRTSIHSNIVCTDIIKARQWGSARIGLLEVGVAGGTVGLGIVVQVWASNDTKPRKSQYKISRMKREI
jgi:hypothetical protein